MNKYYTEIIYIFLLQIKRYVSIFAKLLIFTENMFL